MLIPGWREPFPFPLAAMRSAGRPLLLGWALKLLSVVLCVRSECCGAALRAMRPSRLQQLTKITALVILTFVLQQIRRLMPISQMVVNPMVPLLPGSLSPARGQPLLAPAPSTSPPSPTHGLTSGHCLSTTQAECQLGSDPRQIQILAYVRTRFRSSAARAIQPTGPQAHWSNGRKPAPEPTHQTYRARKPFLAFDGQVPSPAQRPATLNVWWSCVCIAHADVLAS